MSTVTEQENEPQEIELQLLLEAIYRRYGYDFRSYSVASVRRRVQQHLIVARYDNICALMHDILHNGQ